MAQKSHLNVENYIHIISMSANIQNLRKTEAYLNTKHANVGLTDLEVRTWQVRTSKYNLRRTGGRTEQQLTQ